LPKDLRTAIRQLDDQELARLLSASLAEQARRKKSSPEESVRNRRAEAAVVSLPQGRLNAIRAAFKAGVTASRIARQFGISLSDVKRALERDAKKR
jgi:DNA invertase Pin-like site-specific DNA recombinase